MGESKKKEDEKKKIQKNRTLKRELSGKTLAMEPKRSASSSNEKMKILLIYKYVFFCCCCCFIFVPSHSISFVSQCMSEMNANEEG